MSAVAFEELRRTWNVATSQRDARTVKFMTVVALLLTVVIPIVGGISLVQEQRLPIVQLLQILLGIGTFWLAIVWAFVFVPGSIVMNSAANARLLPRQRRRLLQLALGGWLLVSAAMAAAIGQWKVLPLVGMYLLGFALMMSGRMGAIVLTFVPGFWPMLARHVLPAPLAQALSGNAGSAAASVLLLGAAVWVMARLYPAGGDRHLKQWGEQAGRLRRIDAAGWSAGNEPRGVLAAPGLRVYGASLRRACRDKRPGTMLMHALGPNAHWSAWLVLVGMLLLGSLALRILAATQGGDAVRGFIVGFSWSGLTGLGLMVAFSTAQFRQHLNRTRGEQALLRLTPLAGDPRLLNRRLTMGMLKMALTQWSMLSAALMTLATAAGHDAVLRQFAVCCLCGQVSLAVVFGDFARQPTLGLPRGMLLALLAAVELAAAAGLGWLSGDILVATWPWLIAISVAGAAITLWRGWRGMMAVPVAFPAGRLA